MIIRTTIRIDCEDDDPRLKVLLHEIKSQGFTTTHPKGIVEQKQLNGVKKI